jgi:FKBP-type peptidyl-prolyl cis-trans isomerase 2
MATAVKTGDKVAVHYTGKLPDGSVFDSSRKRGPLEFVVGEGRVIPGFEKAVAGMTPGESKTAEIPAADAYGDHRPEMVVEIERENVPADTEVAIGQEFQVQTTGGQTLTARVVDTSKRAVILDANHPLAGQNLTFDIEVVKVER